MFMDIKLIKNIGKQMQSTEIMICFAAEKLK